MADLFPFGVYDTKLCAMVHLGLYENEAACWQVFGGWPSEEEIEWHKGHGLRVLPVTVSYDPPRLT